MHNTILPPFKAAAEAGVATFMNSFNDIDGIPATGHKQLQRDILKGKWGWNGFVVSDWGSIGEMRAHGYAEDKKHAAQIALNAGSDMDMESYAYETCLQTLLNENKVRIDQINDAVRRVLRLKFQLGLFEDPYKYCDENREKNEVYAKEHLAIARDVAKKSIVLLKNENKLFPLSKKIKSIAIIGPLSNEKDTPLGNWRAKDEYNSAVSLLEGVKSMVEKNTGDRTGEEVVQLYIRDLVGSLVRPIKELKGFEKVILKSGETKTVTFTINSKVLQFYTINKKWEVEPEKFNVWVGCDSNASLKKTFRVIDK